MKVVFLENVQEYKIGEVREVADGYARNFLLPRGVAEEATEGKIKEIDAKLSKLKKEEQERVAGAKAEAEKLKKLKLSLVEEVNEEGHLYGSVTNREIADLLASKKFDIDPANIEIPEPIKELGEHVVRIAVGHGIECDLTVTVNRKE